MLSIKEALALRAEIKSHRSTDRPLSNIVTEILFGTYDKDKSEAEAVAIDDYNFLTEEDRLWKVNKGRPYSLHEKNKMLNLNSEK